MKPIITIDARLIKIAAEMTGIHDRSELIQHAIKKLVEFESGRRLAALGGKDKMAFSAPRRRSKKI